MATTKKAQAAPQLTFDEFVQTATTSALMATRRQLEIGELKIPPKIWVGIIIDPFSDLGRFGGPGA